jgi:hypothetical protein
MKIYKAGTVSDELRGDLLCVPQKSWSEWAVATSSAMRK